eukprot:10790161-Alexandrium_andersonii.AAC.1
MMTAQHLKGFTTDLLAAHTNDIKRYGGRVPFRLAKLAKQRSKKNASRDVRRGLMRHVRASQAVPEFYEFQATGANGWLKDGSDGVRV